MDSSAVWTFLRFFVIKWLNYCWYFLFYCMHINLHYTLSVELLLVFFGLFWLTVVNCSLVAFLLAQSVSPVCHTEHYVGLDFFSSWVLWHLIDGLWTNYHYFFRAWESSCLTSRGHWIFPLEQMIYHSFQLRALAYFSLCDGYSTARFTEWVQDHFLGSTQRNGDGRVGTDKRRPRRWWQRFYTRTTVDSGSSAVFNSLPIIYCVFLFAHFTSASTNVVRSADFFTQL